MPRRCASALGREHDPTSTSRESGPAAPTARTLAVASPLLVGLILLLTAVGGAMFLLPSHATPSTPALAPQGKGATILPRPEGATYTGVAASDPSGRLPAHAGAPHGSSVRPLGTASLTANGQSGSLSVDVGESVDFDYSYSVAGGYVCTNGAYDFCIYDMEDGAGTTFVSSCTGAYSGTFSDTYASAGSYTAGSPGGSYQGYLLDENAYSLYEGPCVASEGYVDDADWNTIAVTVYADPTVAVAPGGPLNYDVGQTATTLSATLSYSGPNTATITWYDSSSSTCGASSSSTGTTGTTLVPSTSTAGTTYYCAVVTDSGVPGYSSASAAVQVVVNLDPTVSTPTATPTVIDLGQSVSFSATVAQGSGGFTYLWSGLPAGCTSSSSDPLTCTPTSAGTSLVSVKATDSDGYSVTSGSLSFTVNGPLSVSGIVVSPSPALTGKPVSFSATVGGGTAPPTYAWSLGFGQKSASATPTATYTVLGNFTVYLNVTDGAGVTKGATATVVVDSPMTVSASSAPADPVAGQLVWLNVTKVVGGTGKYHVQWDPRDGSGKVLSGSSVAYAYSTSGSFTARVWVNDSLGLSGSSNVTLTVLPPLLLVGVSGAPGSVTVGSPVSFAASAVGGLAPLSYTWNFGDSSSGSGSSTSHSYAVAGTYTVTVTATDAATPTHTASRSITEQVNPSGGCVGACPISVALGYSPSVPIAGLPVLFTAGPSGGSGTYTSFSWTFGDGVTSTTGTGSATHTYAAAGSYLASVTVVDSAGNSGSAPAVSILVLAPSGLTASVAASPSPADVGQPVVFTAAALGGSGTYSSFTFSFGDGSAPVAVTIPPITTTHAFASAGTYGVTVTVVDTTGASKTSFPTEVVVYPALSVGLSSPTSAVDTGVPVNFTAVPVGGSGNYASLSAWTFAGTELTGPFTEGHTFSGAGTAEVEVEISDASTGAEASGFLNLTVYPAVTVVITSDEVNPPAPAEVNLTATIHGGHAPYTLLWTFGDGSSSLSMTSSTGSASVTHRYVNAGLFVATVKVTDGYGGSAKGAYNGTVAQPSANPFFTTSAWGIPWWLLLVIVAVVVAALMLVLLARRRRPRSAEEGLEAFSPTLGGFAGAEVGAAPETLAPLVPPGASDLSPDDYGGALPPVLSGPPPGSTSDTELVGPGAPPGPTAAQLVQPPTVCAHCGAALGPPGAPCPVCQYVSVPGILAPVASLSGPSPPPSQGGPLTNCPQCSGPLTPTGDCPACQLHWEPEPVPVPSIGPPSPLSATEGLPPPEPPRGSPSELTNCPQCGAPLSAGRACMACGVVWEPTTAEPSGFTDRGTSEAPAPQVAEVPRPKVEAEPSTAPLPRASSMEVPAPPVAFLPSAGAEAASKAPPSAPAKEVAPAGPSPAPSPASSGPSSSPSPGPSGDGGRCFICNGPLDHGFCSKCNMSWSNEPHS